MAIINYTVVNIDTRIPANLIKEMNKAAFPSVFNYPILITEDKILLECIKFIKK